LGVGLVLASPAAAHVLFDRVTLRQWVAGATAVAIVDFEGDASMWQAPDGSDRQEFFRVRVRETLHGDLPAGPLEFFPHAEGFPAFRDGDRAIVFLERSADRVEFRRVAARFPWWSGQGAGHEWVLPPGADGDAIAEVARRLAALRADPSSTDAPKALREHVATELASGVPRLRRDAIVELMRARAWPGFLDADAAAAFARFADARSLPPLERLALVRVLDGAPGFDGDARLVAMTTESLAERELVQLVRNAGSSRAPALRTWLATLRNDARPTVRREAQAALAPADTQTASHQPE
jgi:hypothetical protein